MKFFSKIWTFLSGLVSRPERPRNPTSLYPAVWASQFRKRYGRSPTPLDIRSAGWMHPVHIFKWEDLITSPYESSDREERMLEVLKESFPKDSWINDGMGVIWFGDSDDAVQFKLMSY